MNRPFAFDVVLRKARDEDVDFLVSLSQRVFRTYAEQPGQGMMRMLQSSTTDVIVAASPEERLGFVAVDFVEIAQPFGPWARPVLARLDAIAVRPNIRRRGLGRRLVFHAESIARSRGALAVSLMTAETNHRARRLFEAAGYTMMAPLDDVYIDGQTGVAMLKAL
jgi:ribosomal protein S18 acetylase RimI-like enzyme